MGIHRMAAPMKLENDLSHLEPQLGIVCENGKCTGQAMFIVRIHPVDHCNRPRLDVHGDRVFTLCPECTKDVGRRVGETLADLYAKPEYLAGEKWRCKTCGRHVEKLHDLYNVESLVRR